MAHGKVSPEEVMDMLREVAETIERGGVAEVTLKFDMVDGEKELKFSLRTEEERQQALLAIRTILGQIH